VSHLNLSELVGLVKDLAEVTVTVLVAYVVYKVALLIDSLSHRLKQDKNGQPGD
jgi:hypothetical protein